MSMTPGMQAFVTISPGNSDATVNAVRGLARSHGLSIITVINAPVSGVPQSDPDANCLVICAGPTPNMLQYLNALEPIDAVLGVWTTDVSFSDDTSGYVPA